MTALAAGIVTGADAVRAADPRPPNLVFIFIDDLGYGDVGPFGSVSNRTPNLDRMATEGMKLTSFYAAPVCTPSRAQVLTGCYAKRVSLPTVIGPCAAVGLNPEEHTVAELLKARGYATMCIGKWHCGDHPDFLPTKHGFDRYFGIPYSNDMGSRRGGRPPLPLVRDTTVIEVLDDAGQDRVTGRYTDEAVAFIREKRDGPFFLYFPHTAVHTPIHPGAKFAGKSANGRFGDWVEEVDWSVGRVLDTLRELGLAERTLVIFSSDNGPWLVKGSDGGTAGPLRGGKGGTFEGGVRVPTLAWWPGRVPAAVTCDAVAGNIDLLPTFVSLAGGTVPADRPIDGRDISPLLLGTSKASPREAQYLFAGTSLQAVRSGPWKYAIARQNESMGMKSGAGDGAFSPTLYNLDEDIGERNDVAAKHPDVVKRMQDLISRMDADLGVSGSGPGVREPGRVAKNPGLWLPGSEPVESSSAKPVGVAGLKPGDTLSAEQAPQVGGRAFTIACEVDPTRGSGPIVAHGGASVGYALHLVAGKPAFTIRQKATVVTVTAPDAPSKAFRIEARLAADGAMSLAVDGRIVAKGRAPGPIPNQPVEDFCVGCDTKIAVADYGGPARFRGEIRNLAVTAE
jgi:arylsulfatase A-like enzyme